ncbi:uncharacterized protein LOC135618957 isoform X2 [Musa acuminata AAA Group]
MITVRCYDPTAWIEALAGSRYLVDDGRDDGLSPLGCWQSAPQSSIIRFQDVVSFGIPGSNMTILLMLSTASFLCWSFPSQLLWLMLRYLHYQRRDTYQLSNHGS